MTVPRGRRLVGPLYLLACLLLGGSGQTPVLAALLQLGAVAILCWAALERRRSVPLASALPLGLLIVGMLLIVAVHLLPLPPQLWSLLPGRDLAVDGLRTLGLVPGWQPLSLAPYDTVSNALALLPPLAMLAAIVVLRAFSKEGLVAAIVAGTGAGLALGILQMTASTGDVPRFYLQAEVDPGAPSGFFPNPNHMATLLLVALPFLGALLASRSGGPEPERRGHAPVLAALVAMLCVVAGLMINGSLAGLALLVPVAMAVAMMLVPLRGRLRYAARIATVLVAAGAVLLLLAPLAPDAWRRDSASLSTRHRFWTTSWATALDYAPAGSGIGTFSRVYAIKAQLEAFDPTAFVNHAHNDYLETIVETGLPGALLVLLFLGWWGRTAWRVLRLPAFDLYARAGAVASATILAHSIVDYPLRTSALAACLAMALGLMLVSRRETVGSTDLRPTRHTEIR